MGGGERVRRKRRWKEMQKKSRRWEEKEKRDEE